MQKKLLNIWAVILFIVISVLLPYFVPKDGYSYIGNNKVKFFFISTQYLVLIFFTLLLLFLIINLIKNRKSFSFKMQYRLSNTDICALLYAVVCILSYGLSAYKEVALLGNYEWYMGLATQLILVFIYFSLSRHMITNNMILYALAIINMPIAFLTVANRFGYYPIPIVGAHPMYVSTIGNVNWFCGYFIIIVAIELILYFQSTSMKLKLITGLCLFLSLAALIAQGSISGYVTLFLLLIILLKSALKDKENLQNYLEILLLLFTGCFCMYISQYVIPGAYVQEDPTIHLIAFSPLPCICLFVTFILYLAIRLRCQTAHLSYLYKYIIVGIVGCFIIYLICGLTNTFCPNITPWLNGNTLFTFDKTFGSYRGGTYTIGIQAFLSLPLLNKLVGIGPDCFLSYVYSHMDKIPMAQYFTNPPMANAHSELLTALVNTGILGLISYAGIFFSSIKNSLKQNTLYSTVILFGILGYMLNNLFSFQQIISTPFMFALLGFLECNLRKERENVTN